MIQTLEWAGAGMSECRFVCGQHLRSADSNNLLINVHIIEAWRAGVKAKFYEGSFSVTSPWQVTH